MSKYEMMFEQLMKKQSETQEEIKKLRKELVGKNNEIENLQGKSSTTSETTNNENENK